MVTASKKPNPQVEPDPPSRARWIVEKLVVPVIVAVVSTAAFSEVVLNWFSLRTNSPNWIGSSFQPSEKSGALGQYYDDWTMIGESGRVNAKIQPEDGGNKELWIASGSERTGRRTLSYVSEKPENMGTGVFYLERVSGKQEYRGRQIMFDCTVKKMLSCPYILVPYSARDLFAQAEYQAYLKQGCIELTSTPIVQACMSLP